MTNKTKLDISASSVVVVCIACPWWSAFAWTPLAGHDRASAHEQREHPEDSGAQSARAVYRRRHAVGSSDVK